MFAVSRGRGGLDVKLDDIADRPGAALVTGHGANGRYPRRSASFPASRQRRADYIPSRSGRRSAGSTQQRDALPVLRHAPVAHLGVRSAASRTGTDAPPSAPTPCASRQPIGDALAQQPAPPRLHRHTPLDTAVPVLGTLLHPLVACVAPRRRLSAMQQRSRLRHVACVGRRRRQAVARPDPASTPMCAFIPKYHCLPFFV